MDEPATVQARLSELPSIDELLSRPSLVPMLVALPRAVQVRACREAVARARARLLAGEDLPFSEGDVARALSKLARPNLRRVLNATGVVLHTNLGRAPLAARALQRLTDVARGYCNLELNLEEGERGSRYAPVVDLLCALTGAEDALVVNNCAAAVLLAFGALAQGREAVVSRGELVEIGGGFRIPDVMRQSGARLVEVGTTNRTRLSDYAQVIGPETGLLVKVHRSNFAVVGFSEEVTTKELAALAQEKGVPLFEDLGSGLLRPLHGEGLTPEPSVSSAIAAGADVVAFSGDKLLGGPQAGLLVGRRAIIERLARHPLNRALRIDKLTIAALEATLELYRDGVEDAQVPVRALLSQPLAALERRAQALAAALAAARIPHRVVSSSGQVGGGSMPLSSPASFAVALPGPGATALHDHLRAGAQPLVARIVDDEVWLDVRCLEDADLEAVAQCVAGAISGSTPW